VRGRVGFSVYPNRWHAFERPLRRRGRAIRAAKIRASRVVWKLVQRDGYGKFSVGVGRYGEYSARECGPPVREKTRGKTVGRNNRVAGRPPRLEDV
jgi:hypothetical protein